MELRDLIISVVRTAVVPPVVGYLLSLLFKVGVAVDHDTFSLVVTGIITGAYYSFIRVLESKYSWFGVLLGWKAQPVYVKSGH